ncbi:cyclin a2-1 [Trifolium repens]|nr:cyclin a2-1 [Trifolium repens]
MSNEDKTPIGSSEENRIVPDQEDNANIVVDPLLCYESAASLFDNSELSGMDHVMSDQTVSLNEDNMVTPVNLKANIVVDLQLWHAAGLFDDYLSVEMSDQTVILNEDIMVSPIQEKVAADDSQLWRESATEIFGNCHNAEEPVQKPLEKAALTPKDRAVLIDWLVKTCVELKLQTDTLYSSVHLLDWFFSTSYIEVGRYHLLGISCLLIASKYEELEKSQPRIQYFCLDTEDAYRIDQIIDMEKRVWDCVGHHLVDPTTNTFLRMFLVVAKASPKLQCMSSFLAELSLLSQKFEPYLPSRVAASAVFLARWTLDPSQNPWDQSLEEFTTYKAHDLRSVVFDLQALQRRQTEYNLWTRIYNKYSQPKFQNVAALYSDDLVDTMF